jgi:hypothetical protein
MLVAAEIFIGILAAIFLVGIAFAVCKGVNNMTASSDPKERPELAPELTSAVAPNVAAFLAARGFRFANAYQFHRIRVGHWVEAGNSPPLRRLSVALSRAGTNYEFITEFSDDDSLTTTKTRAAFMLPRPFGSFLQSFPNASIEELWDLHLRGEQHLITHLSIPVKESRIPYLEAFGPGILRQMRCVKSYPLWPIRGIYWFLLKRFLMLNRPIWSQNVSKLYRQTA